MKRLGVRPPSGILMHGPPGCGKVCVCVCVCVVNENERVCVSQSDMSPLTLSLTHTLSFSHILHRRLL